MNDPECLQRYLHEQSQEAFGMLVSRYVNLVYSAALRQVKNAALAEEVTQLVFVDLARRARPLPAEQPLAPWLYVVTRRTAVDLIRREARRAARERTAAELLAMNSPPDHWPRLRDEIDDGMESLGEAERAAIVLRFFENCSLNEVGAALGISEDAAQKRVTRGLERLRKFFRSRGVVVTAAALATDLSAHGVEAAPGALGASISAAAASALHGTAGPAALGISKIIAMTVLQKSVLVTALVLAAGAGIFESTTLFRQENELARAQQENDELSTEISRLRADQERAARRLGTVEGQIDSRLQGTSTAPGDRVLEAQMEDWLSRVDRLKAAFETTPNLATPELKLLTPQQWLEVASANKLQSDEDLRRAMAELRNLAINGIASRLGSALSAYVAAHDGALPDDTRQLAPFFHPAVDPELLGGFEMLRTGLASDASKDARSPVLESKPIDVEFDHVWRIGTRMVSAGSAVTFDIGDAQKAFANANGGQRATSADQLVPYLRWPISRNVLDKEFTARNSR